MFAAWLPNAADGGNVWVDAVFGELRIEMIDVARSSEEARFPVSVSARPYSERETEGVRGADSWHHRIPLHAERAAVLGAVKARPGSVGVRGKVRATAGLDSRLRATARLARRSGRKDSRGRTKGWEG